MSHRIGVAPIHLWIRIPLRSISGRDISKMLSGCFRKHAKGVNVKKKRVSGIVVLGLFCLLYGSCSQKTFKTTEILWDTWGIPHIFAEDASSLFYAYGWAQMQSHGDLILKLYGEARGRAAEYWGEAFLSADKLIHTLSIPKSAQSWYAAQRSPYREYLDAFAAGMNAYAQANPGQIAAESKPVLPVSGSDPIGHILRVIHHTFVGGSSPGIAQRWSAMGSNAWAIGPSKSESGHSLLLFNPHLSWSDFFMWYESHLVTKDLDAYGATLVGFPILGIAFNEYLGWTHTVNPIDGADLFELTLTEDGMYIFDGEKRAFDTEEIRFNVKQQDGILHEEHLTVKHSVHGPVLAEKDGKALALRLAGLDQPHLFEQEWKMINATDLSSFEDALKPLQVPFFNVIYADRDGHILYLFNGRIPMRNQGDSSFWGGIVPGDSSDTLWTETHPYEDLPRVADPPNGWVQNANDPPWTSTMPMVLDPEEYPPYISPLYLPLRAQRSIRMLQEDEYISFEELIAYKHSTRMELADRILDELILAAKKREDPQINQAVAILETWDRQADADSRGALLFSTWVQKTGFNMFANTWDPENPLSTPNGLTDPEGAVDALVEAAQEVLSLYGSLDVPWGDVFRLRFGGIDLPGNGGPGSLGIFRVIGYSPDSDQRYRAVGGDSFVAVVEFSNPVRASALLSYGNASQPGSKHRFDQLELLSQKKLRPIWKTRPEIEAHLENREVIQK